MIVLDKDGLQGTFDLSEPSAFGGKIAGGEKETVVVRFENGQHIAIPREMLIPQGEGQYMLAVSVKELVASQQNGTFEDHASSANRVEVSEQELVIPVIAEQVSVQKHTRETGVVEIRKTIHERTEVIDLPLLTETVEIERISVNRVIDEPVGIRHEGDTTIIPLLEEVLFVEKRLVLREEVHVKRVQHEAQETKSILLREEQVEIARRPGDDPGSQHDAA